LKTLAKLPIFGAAVEGVANQKDVAYTQLWEPTNYAQNFRLKTTDSSYWYHKVSSADFGISRSVSGPL